MQVESTDSAVVLNDILSSSSYTVKIIYNMLGYSDVW